MTDNSMASMLQFKHVPAENQRHCFGQTGEGEFDNAYRWIAPGKEPA
jgi:hypothetical protein